MRQRRSLPEGHNCLKRPAAVPALLHLVFNFRRQSPVPVTPGFSIAMIADEPPRLPKSPLRASAPTLPGLSESAEIPTNPPLETHALQRLPAALSQFGLSPPRYLDGFKSRPPDSHSFEIFPGGLAKDEPFCSTYPTPRFPPRLHGESSVGDQCRFPCASTTNDPASPVKPVR